MEKKRQCFLNNWHIFQFDHQLNEDLKQVLLVDFYKQELLSTVMKMHNNKSPGNDGVNACFFKSFCSTVNIEVWNVVENFFNSGIMPDIWKENFVVLIPKVSNAYEVTKFRPISLC